MASKWKVVKIKTAAMMRAATILKSVPHGMDSTRFLKHIPAEIRDAVPLMYTLSADVMDSLLHAAIVCAKDPAGGDEAFQAAAMDSAEEVVDTRVTVFTALLLLVQAAVREKAKVSIIQADLTSMNVSPEVVQSFVNAIRKHRHELELAASSTGTGFPSLSGCQWRVDVVISSSQVAKVLRPTVLMRLTLSDGSVKTFEVPVDKFHELRYNVAKVLKEMRTVERNPVLRLAFDMDKRQVDDGPAA